MTIKRYMDRGQSEAVRLCLVLMAATFLLHGCSKERTKDVSWCTPDAQLSSFWADLKLPNVEGAVLCRDFTSGKKDTVEYIHYRNKDQHYADYAEKYKQAFERNGWSIKGVTPGETYLIMSLNKNGRKFVADFQDCVLQASDARLCSVVQIHEGE